MAKPDALTAITTIDGYREVWEGLIPEENFDWFLARIKTAVGLAVSEESELASNTP